MGVGTCEAGEDTDAVEVDVAEEVPAPVLLLSLWAFSFSSLSFLAFALSSASFSAARAFSSASFFS